MLAACENRPHPHESMWATLGNDAIKDVQAAIQSGELAGTMTVERSGKGASAVRLDGIDPSEISRPMHSKYGRCGGFTFQDDQGSALKALDNPLAEEGMRKQATVYSIDNDSVARALIARLDASKITEQISAMSAYVNRYYSTATGVSSAKDLRDRWVALAKNRPDADVQLYTHSWKQPSVIMTIQGITKASEIVVIGGHLDSTAGWSPTTNTRAPGADDDASGIATLTEVARAVLESGMRPARTLMFIGYAAEEVGLRGSRDIAAKFKDENKSVVGVMQLDMTNYLDATKDIVMISDSNAAQNAFVGELIDRYVQVKWSFAECGYACSDHASWTNQGYASTFPLAPRLTTNA